MFRFFKKKSPTQKALCVLQSQCRNAQPAELIAAGVVVDALCAGFIQEFGSMNEFRARDRSEQDEYLRRLADLQHHGQTKLGTDLIGLWVISAQIGDSETHFKAGELMGRISRQANGVQL